MPDHGNINEPRRAGAISQPPNKKPSALARSRAPKERSEHEYEYQNHEHGQSRSRNRGGFTMNTLARNEQREQLRYCFTLDERRERGQRLADAHIKLKAVNEELDRVKADYKARISTIDNEITLLSTQVSTGYEMREYVCFFEYDQPEKGKKTLRRKEPPCDIVRVEEMTEADRQTVMDSIDKQAAAEQTDPASGTIVPFTPQSPAGPKNVTPPKPPTGEDDELEWAKKLEAQRKQTAAEEAEKKKAAKGKGRKTSSGGVVATEADGPEITTEDDKKGAI